MLNRRDLFAAMFWLIIVCIASAYLTTRIVNGLNFGTDLLALLPQQDRDPKVQAIKDKLSEVFSRQIIILLGHRDREQARAAGADLAETMSASSLFTNVSYQFSEDQQQKVARTVFPYRSGLLSSADRFHLASENGEALFNRAMASVYGPAGFADIQLLKHDPFLLLPTFLADLPLGMPRLTVDNGILSSSQNGITYVLFSAQLKRNSFALVAQEAVIGITNQTISRLKVQYPGLETLQTGAVFYAEAGARDGIREASLIGGVSIIGTMLLIICAFRALQPLLLSLLSIGTGLICAFAVSLWIFDELHVIALLFGTSLVGVAVDYSLHYSATSFGTPGVTPRGRLREILPGLCLGLGTTVIGYIALLLAPFPGLHQIAIFSSIGLVAAFFTVVLWFPYLDRAVPPNHGKTLLKFCAGFDRFWHSSRKTNLRVGLLCLTIISGVIGAVGLRKEDDIRRMQSLSPILQDEEQKIRNITGLGSTGAFFLIQAETPEAALQVSEHLTDQINVLQTTGALTGYQSAAQIVPSMARQIENRTLVEERLLKPYLAHFFAQIGLSTEDLVLPLDGKMLTLEQLSELHPLLSLLLLGSTGETQVISLLGVTQIDIIRSIAEGISGVRFFEPTTDISNLLGQYRIQAIALTAISAFLMAVFLTWRYGWSAFRVMLPPTIALVMSPLLLALFGLPVTFFTAMALILILAIGVDYAIFFRESTGERVPSTMLGVLLSALTTILSFGLLACSRVAAVNNFGTTMLIGISLAFFLAPLAGKSVSIKKSDSCLRQLPSKEG